MKASRSFAASITRPSNTTAYTAADVIGDTNGSAIIDLSGLFAPVTTRKNFLIVSAALDIQIAAVPSGMTTFRLHLFNAAPAAIADNAAFALSVADSAKYLGYLDLGTPAVFGSVLHTQADSINKLITVPAGAVYGVLQTAGAYTPASASVFVLTVSGIDPDQ